MPELLLAVDVGGTFTDAYLHGPGGPWRAKAPTTPDDRTRGVVDAVDRALAEADVEAGAIDRVLHGTTAATNALLEGELARTALVTNAGFEDILEIGRQTRPSLYDLDETRPDPIVPRALRFGVSARLDASGEERAPVDAGEVDRIAGELAGRDVDAVAVGLLHAHRSTRHEAAVADGLRERLDGVEVVASSETSPEPREVERLTTTVVNAALRPRVGRYLDALERRLTEAGVRAPVRVLDSNAATLAPDEVARLPVRAALSGPAGGAAANRHLAEAADAPTLLGVDTGGTSTDASLVRGGEATTRWRVEVAGRALQIPAVDVHTVGAGGGSVAWRDEAGGLRVGPESAGAEPGPACYGRGGRRPTVTDANLVLERIPPSAALAGELELDADAAREAVASLGDDVRELARSILEIALARTVRGLRSLTARHAVDPGRAALAAFGGAGPQFGAAWARRLGVPRVLVPRAAGVTSAQGLLAAPPRVERSQGLLVSLGELAGQRYDELAARLADEARRRLADVDEPEIVHRVSARYEGQSHELTVPVPGKDPARVPEAFEARHEAQHGYTLEEPVEVVALRVEARGPPALAADEEPAPKPRDPPSPVETVEAAFLDHGGARETPVYREGDLEPGVRLEGPAIVASPDTTVLVPPDARGRVHASGAIDLDLGGPG